MAIKIIQKSYAEIVPFYKLELGAVFVIKDGDLPDDGGYKYMKVRNDGEYGIYNAVNLTNGRFSLVRLNSSTFVEEIRAELTLEDNDC